jgi:transcriptional regulator with XRE-family HTH domain
LQCSSGARLRGIRILGCRTLEDVVAAAGSGESFVSQVERGRTGTRLATPQDLAGVFRIEVSDLFVGDSCRVWASCAAVPARRSASHRVSYPVRRDRRGPVRAQPAGRLK